MRPLNSAELEAGLDHIRQSPEDGGTVELIVRRPAVDQREVLEMGGLDPVKGLVGDRWQGTEVETQLTIMNARAIALFAQETDRWQLAGDQLYLDIDLSTDNLPPGTRLSLGSAVIEVTAQPHNGCNKFSGRFGVDALRLTRSDEGRRLRLRGLYAKVVRPGLVARGDAVKKVI